MIDLQYTITKFDNTKKLITVSFSDGAWAEIQLTNPLPKNITELENIIKQYSAPVEAIEISDTDLSYINSLLNIEKTTTRFSLTPNNNEQSDVVDPEIDAQMKMWQDAQFQHKVGEALVAFGVINNNPASIAVDE